jgi:hypothetical protein
MIDDAKRLIGRYPHIALGCCGVGLVVVSFTVFVNLQLVMPYLVRHLGRWMMLPVLIAQVTLVVTGVMLFGGAILWGLHRRRTTS